MRVTPVYGLHLFSIKFIWDLFGLLACLIVNDNKGNRKIDIQMRKRLLKRKSFFKNQPKNTHELGFLKAGTRNPASLSGSSLASCWLLPEPSSPESLPPSPGSGSPVAIHLIT